MSFVLVTTLLRVRTAWQNTTKDAGLPHGSRRNFPSNRRKRNVRNCARYGRSCKWTLSEQALIGQRRLNCFTYHRNSHPHQIFFSLATIQRISCTYEVTMFFYFARLNNIFLWSCGLCFAFIFTCKSQSSPLSLARSTTNFGLIARKVNCTTAYMTCVQNSVSIDCGQMYAFCGAEMNTWNIPIDTAQNQSQAYSREQSLIESIASDVLYARKRMRLLVRLTYIQWPFVAVELKYNITLQFVQKRTSNIGHNFALFF